jgi:hypothetical protein
MENKINKYLVLKKIPDDNEAGKYPGVGEIFEASEYGLSNSTIKYLISHTYITTYHEGM